jgi:hypothetical protein
MLVVRDSREAREPRPDGVADELAPFDPAHRGEWWWRQPTWRKRQWRLEQDGRLVGLYQGEGLFSTTSRMRFAGAEFEIQRGWTGNASVLPLGAKEPLARLVPRWMGAGRIELPAGEPLELVTSGILWNRVYELQTTDQLLLVRFESHDHFLTQEVQIVPEDYARRRQDLLPLLTLVAAMAFAPKRHSPDGAFARQAGTAIARAFRS